LIFEGIIGCLGGPAAIVLAKFAVFPGKKEKCCEISSKNPDPAARLAACGLAPSAALSILHVLCVFCALTRHEKWFRVLQFCQFFPCPSGDRCGS
jgi:hypothetical protein